MNGATSKSFMKNLSGSDFTSHKNKRRFFEAADINKAVGMQKGKSLFTTQHHLSPEPSIDINAVAKSNGKKMKNLPLNTIERYDEYEARGWQHDDTSKLSTKDTLIRGARNMMQGAADTAKEVLPYAMAGGTIGAVKSLYDRLAKKEGTALEESSNSEKDDTTKDEKESKTVNLNYTPDKATIVAMRKSYYGK